MIRQRWWRGRAALKRDRPALTRVSGRSTELRLVGIAVEQPLVGWVDVFVIDPSAGFVLAHD